MRSIKFFFTKNFEKFIDGLNEAVTAIQTNNVGRVEPEVSHTPEIETQITDDASGNYTDVNFDLQVTLNH